MEAAGISSASAGDSSPALLARGALRRLAADGLAPTPENYARAYRREAGETVTAASLLPAPAQRLVERLAARAFDADVTRASADFTAAMAEGRWDDAGHALDTMPRVGAEALADLIERIIEGVERGGRQWTPEQRRSAIQRVLDASRKDPRTLQRRLAQMVGRWDGDNTEPGPVVDETSSTLVATETAAVAPEGTASVAPSTASEATLAWPRMVESLVATLQRAVDREASDPDVAKGFAAALVRLREEGPGLDLAERIEDLGHGAGRLLRHRHHLAELLGQLTLELTASLTDLAENDSWVRGQCDAMRLKIEEGLTARGVRAVSEMLRSTRKRHGELRVDREKARDALKLLINRMLSEVGELGSRTGDFHESVGRYATVIEKADSLERLTGVVREMVEESRTVQSLVEQAQQRLQSEHAKATELMLRVTELEGAMKRLSDEVATDQLTQIANRRGLMMSFSIERARCERTGRPLSIGLIDIDNFKRLNDELGHTAGDEALKSLAALIRNNLRPTDHVARYGGEEFVVLLPDTPVEEGEKVLTRLQRQMTGGLFMHKERQVFVTFSAGVTLHRLEERIEDTLERADQGLYQAKHAGKNRTCIA